MKKLTAIFLFTLILLVSLFAASCKPAETKSVKLKYYADASALLPAMKTGKETIGLLPEPAASKIQNMNPDYGVKLNVQTLYGGNYPQAVLVVKKSVAESDSAFVSALISAVTENATWIKESNQNIASAISGIKEVYPTTSLDANSITVSVVENCNVYYENSLAAKTSVTDYINAMRSIESTAAKPLADEFYYVAPETPTENLSGSYSVFMPDGAPALSFGKLIADDNQLDRTISYNVVAADMIGGKVAQKIADVCVLPLTAASKVIGTGDDYLFVAVMTHGNLFIVSSENITSINDLNGKTIGVIGQGQVPDLTFKYILSKNGISYEIAD